MSLYLMFLSLAQAQSIRYEVKFQKTPLDEIFKSLEKKHDLLFSYRLEDIQNIKRTIEIKTNNIESLIQKVLESTELDYEIVSSRYILIKTKVSTSSSTNATPPFIHLCGNIIDAMTNEVLPYANVLIQGTSIGTSSSEDGRFVLSYPFEKDQLVIISYVGYEKKVIPWQDLKNVNCTTVKLEYKPFGNESIVITDYLSDGVDLTENGAATKINLKRIGSLPGQVEPNILSVAQFLPGISSPGGKASDIYIRGCTPDQNLIVWEDIPIYHSAHYFGMISAFNPFIIEEMKVYRGGFGAEYGGRIAGVIDLKSGSEKSKKSYTGIGTNMTHAYLYGHQIFKTKRPSALSFSIRRSFSEALRTPTFNNITKVNQQGLLLGNIEVEALPDHIKVKDDFNFTDAHLKYAISLSEQDRFSIAGVYAKNNFNDEIIDNRRMEGQKDSMDLKNRGLSIKWERQWSNRFQTKIIAVKNSYEYDYTYRVKEFDRNKPRLSGIKSNEINDTQVQVIGKFENDKKQVFESGYQLTHYDIDFQINEESTSAKNINDLGKRKGALHTLYASVKNPINKVLGIDIGLRANWFEPEKRICLEPRVRLSYKLNKVLSLHSNFGRHFQFISQVSVFRGNNNGINSSIWSLAGQPGIPVIKSDLFQLGILYDKKDWVVDLQLYQRTIDGISSRATDFENVEDNAKLIGTANIKGIDLLIKKRFNKLQSWISYSLSKANFSFNELQRVSFPAGYDQRHILQWNNQITIKNFDFALGFRYASGVPYSVITGYEERPNSNNSSLEYSTTYDGIHNYTLSGQHEINFSILYNLQPKGNQSWRGYISCSIYNFLNTENINNRTYYLDTPRNEAPQIRFIEKSSLRITPNLSLRLEW